MINDRISPIGHHALHKPVNNSLHHSEFMHKIKNLHDISGFFFFVLAFAYVAMVLALRNSYLPDFFLSMMRILDLPFAFIALLYGASTLGMQLKTDAAGQIKNGGWMISIALGALILFSLVALMNFAFPPII